MTLFQGGTKLPAWPKISPIDGSMHIAYLLTDGLGSRGSFPFLVGVYLGPLDTPPPLPGPNSGYVPGILSGEFSNFLGSIHTP